MIKPWRAATYTHNYLPHLQNPVNRGPGPAPIPADSAPAAPAHIELADDRSSTATQWYPTTVAAYGHPLELVEHQLAVRRSLAVAVQVVAG